MNRRKLFKNTLGLAGGLAANRVLPAEVTVPVETPKAEIEQEVTSCDCCTADPWNGVQVYGTAMEFETQDWIREALGDDVPVKYWGVK